MIPKIIKSHVETTCPYCGVGCGIEVAPKDLGISTKGLKSHPANQGRVCSKGSALEETLSLKTRLLTPKVNRKRTDWNTALDLVANTFAETIQQHGPDSVAFYVSGQILTEDYYVANKLMKGFIGSGNIDTNSRLCMSTAVAGYKRAFGSDTVPACYGDLDLADLIVIVGSNTAWAHPVVYQQIALAKKKRPELKIVVIDPRKTSTADIADMHLPIKPGADAFLFNGLLNYLEQVNVLDIEYIDQYTEGFDSSLQAARNSNVDLQDVADQCELKINDLHRFYEWFAETEKTVTLFSQGVNQSSSGVDKVNSIINVHLATGRIGKPGASPFSITGQPNAMGGREVGGLANQLAAHMDFDNDSIDRVKRFWNAKNISRKPGLKAVDLFDAIEQGTIKAIWIMATNPAASLPESERINKALEKCPFVVVSEAVEHTDTTQHAQVLLPATSWGEKNGTVTNSERCISRQRQFMAAPGECKDDWWIITEVARRMGFHEEFNYHKAADIFREHAALSGFENNGSRDFNISALATLDDAAYNELSPVQWPIDPDTKESKKRLFSDGKFFTPQGKARFIAIKPQSPKSKTDNDYPLALNTGRIRDQWHMMTRTSLASRLNAHRSEPFVEIHQDDAKEQGIEHGNIVKLQSRSGELIARAEIHDGQRKGSVFSPMHWNRQFTTRACVNSLVKSITDPISGQPESKYTPAKISLVKTSWQGFILTRKELNIPFLYWSKIPGTQFTRYEIADGQVFNHWQSWVDENLNDHHGDWLMFSDEAQNKWRYALIKDGQLESLIFIANDRETLDSSWLEDLFRQAKINDRDRMSVLSGMSSSGKKNPGKIVCSCFSIGEKTIQEAVTNGAKSVELLGQKLQAGTNCGSCIPELRELLKKPE